MIRQSHFLLCQDLKTITNKNKKKQNKSFCILELPNIRGESSPEKPSKVKTTKVCKIRE